MRKKSRVMSQFDKKSFFKLEKLSRIHCSTETEDMLSNDLKRILDFIEQLSEVNTDDIPPCNHVLDGILTNILREDEVEETMPRDLFLANAPAKIGGMIQVPPVIQRD